MDPVLAWVLCDLRHQPFFPTRRQWPRWSTRCLGKCRYILYKHQSNKQTQCRNIYIYIVICRVTFPSLFTSSFASTHQHSLCLPKKSVTGYLENLKYQTKRQILPFLLDSPASFDRKVLYQLLQLGCRWPSWSSRKKRTRLSLALDSSGVQIATEKKGGTRYG